MSFGSMDSDFDRYRKNRIRHRAKVPIDGDSSYENSALRELEKVEARELQDQQLTREVHDFFADATRQAATIVERMAHDAEAENEQKIDQEMESFLIDAFARMNGLVMNMLQQRKDGGETRVEPKVANLVGRMLDEFRWEGTADLLDKHIGQDPFATDLDDVRRELQAHVGDPAEMDTDGAAAPIEEHLVANVEPGEAEEPRAEDDMPEVEVVDDVEPEAPAMASEMASAAPESPAIEPASGAATAAASRDELERFKEALKSLVRQGTMTRDEARAAWATRLQALGLVRG
ncbi:MAG: hypothetical protein NXI31_18550 [bacterium]|nr:hypothetical protein [bacterium]